MTERIIKGLSNVLAAIAIASLFLMMLQTVADVLASNFLSKPIAGNLEVISYYHMVFVVFLPLACVELAHEHISVDLFFRRMPRAMQRVVLVLGYLIGVGFFSLMVWRTGLDALKAMRIDEKMMGVVFVTIWPAKFALPIGFGALALTQLLHAAKAAFIKDFDPTPDAPDEIGV